MAKIERDALQYHPCAGELDEPLWCRRVEPGRARPRLCRRTQELGFRAYPFDIGDVEAKNEQQAKFLLRCLPVAAFASMIPTQGEVSRLIDGAAYDCAFS